MEVKVKIQGEEVVNKTIAPSRKWADKFHFSGSNKKSHLSSLLILKTIRRKKENLIAYNLKLILVLTRQKIIWAFSLWKKRRCLYLLHKALLRSKSKCLDGATRAKRTRKMVRRYPTMWTKTLILTRLMSCGD